MMMMAGAVLAGAVAGCSSQPALTEGSTDSCYLFALSAIHRHVTVTSVPPACQGLSQGEVNVAVDRALRAAAAGVRGRVAQRELIGAAPAPRLKRGRFLGDPLLVKIIGVENQ